MIKFSRNFVKEKEKSFFNYYEWWKYFFQTYIFVDVGTFVGYGGSILGDENKTQKLI